MKTHGKSLHCRIDIPTFIPLCYIRDKNGWKSLGLPSCEAYPELVALPACGPSLGTCTSLTVHVVPSKLCRCHRHYMFCPRVSQDPARGPRAHDARQNRASQMGVAGENLSDSEADPVDSLQQLQYSNPTPQRQCNLLSPWLLR